MPLELLNREEEQRHPQRGDRVRRQRVEDGWCGAQPWADVRDQLRDPGPCAEEQRVAATVRQRSGQTEDPQAETGARADDQRQEQLTLDVARQRLLHPLEQRRASLMRREASVDGGFQAM